VVPIRYHILIHPLLIFQFIRIYWVETPFHRDNRQNPSHDVVYSY